MKRSSCQEAYGTLFEDEANLLVLSVASIWEIQIKAQLGKLDLARPLQEIVHDQERTNRIEILPVKAVTCLVCSTPIAP